MDTLDSRIWKQLVVARMNKYYHQNVLRNLKLLSAFSTLLILAALVLGASRFAGYVPTEVPLWLSLSAILLTVFSISFGLGAKISLHENLFREFGEYEGKLAVLNTHIELGGPSPEISADYRDLEVKFVELEGKQPSAFQWMWEREVKRVYREKGVEDSPSPPSAAPSREA